MSNENYKPTQMQSNLPESLYRFCGDPKQVNWEARRHIDLDFHRDIVLPCAYRFCEQAIKDVTFKNDELNAIIGLSGGLDSTVAAYIVANAMQQSRARQKISAANLILLSFVGLEDSDTRSIARDLANRCNDVKVSYREADIRKVRDELHAIVRKETGIKDGLPGELTPRTICSLVNQIGNELNYATIDTTNATEVILGEFSVGLGYDVRPLSDLYKSSVFALGRLLQIPDSVLNRRPVNSAFTFTDKPTLYFGQLPESITPAHAYEVLDTILYWLYERKKSPDDVAAKLGHSKEFVRRIDCRVKNQKCRRQPPEFCIESRKIVWPNSTNIFDEESKEIMEKSMRGDLFK